jgi:hypothetical protein
VAGSRPETAPIATEYHGAGGGAVEAKYIKKKTSSKPRRGSPYMQYLQTSFKLAPTITFSVDLPGSESDDESCELFVQHIYEKH